MWRDIYILLIKLEPHNVEDLVDCANKNKSVGIIRFQPINKLLSPS